MRTTPLMPNLALVLLAGLIPRIPPGSEASGNPILQILYVALFLPAAACFINLSGQKAWPLISTILVCALGSLVWYGRWLILTGGTPLSTGEEFTFLRVALFSIAFAGLIFGIRTVTLSVSRRAHT